MQSRLLGYYPSLRSGTAAVEFAITAPLLFLLLFGLVEFARAMMVQQILTSCSREACRVAIIAGKTKDDATKRITEPLASGGISNYTITYAPDPPSTAKESDPVVVTVQVQLGKVSWLPMPGFLGNINLIGSSTFSRERSY